MHFKKSYNSDDILKTAEKLFLKNGFSRTSMRDIAEKSGVGLGNIYNYFKNKDEIFCRIVEPVVKTLENETDKHHDPENSDLFFTELQTMSAQYISRQAEAYLTLIKKHRRQMELLFFRAEGSSMEKFFERFTDRTTEKVKLFLSALNQKLPQAAHTFDDFTIHIHTVWMITFFREIIMHKISLEKARNIISDYITFESAGWLELMKR